MAIDTVRLLTESAAQLWQRLSPYGTIEAIPASDGFEAWLSSAAARPAYDRAEEQLIRRDYRRFCEILTEIETLVRSRSRALELVRGRVAEQALAAPMARHSL